MNIGKDNLKVKNTTLYVHGRSTSFHHQRFNLRRSRAHPLVFRRDDERSTSLPLQSFIPIQGLGGRTSVHKIEADTELALSSCHFIIEGAHGRFGIPNSSRSLFTKDVLRCYASILQESPSHSHLFSHASATRYSSIDEALGHHTIIIHGVKIFAVIHASLFSCICNKNLTSKEALGYHETKIHVVAHAFLSCASTKIASSKLSSSYGVVPRRLSYRPQKIFRPLVGCSRLLVRKEFNDEVIPSF
ncbi:UNVERIFIED_CONTAM: hypothetical protein Slati_3483700 [Sesamum latifolium]|uniref:C2H2-type domain-containing protein n=1 Tax=Sesamum latifolium TaxID=2727402 RepID=A0AAW2UH75_9LAMI